MDDELPFLIYDSYWSTANQEIKTFIRDKYLIDKYGNNDEEHINFICITEFTNDMDSIKKKFIEVNPLIDELVIFTIKDIPETFNSLIPKNIKIKNMFYVLLIYCFD
jgi:hypothetical protein